jgi:cytochrome c peroxidase
MTFRFDRFLIVRLACIFVLASAPSAQAGEFEFSADEIARIASHGPWPMPSKRDTGNRVSGNPAAIHLGYRLFFEPRLAANQQISCATCHQPGKSLQDGLATARGLQFGVRNTPGLWNVGQQRWFGWDGGHDNLWSASLRPILDPTEMGGDTKRTARLLRSQAELDCLYQQAFGKAPDPRDENLMVNVAKAIAAWQETLVSPATPFDALRDALLRGDDAAVARHAPAVRRGLRLFLGRGQCATCHAGPLFSNGEFGDIGVPFFIKPEGVDPGRQGGIKRLMATPHNLLGRHNDDSTRENATATRHLRPEHRNFGEFKVPSLRNLRYTAPYMHNGSLATLRDVVRHYSEIDEDRLHSDGERILRPLHLSESEIDDLLAFLESLSPDDPMESPAPPPKIKACNGTAGRPAPHRQGPPNGSRAKN